MDDAKFNKIVDAIKDVLTSKYSLNCVELEEYSAPMRYVKYNNGTIDNYLYPIDSKVLQRLIILKYESKYNFTAEIKVIVDVTDDENQYIVIEYNKKYCQMFKLYEPFVEFVGNIIKYLNE